MKNLSPDPTTPRSEALDLHLSVADVARGLRHVAGLTVLTGSWIPGEAIVCWDPVRTLDDDDDPFAISFSVEHDIFAGGWIGTWGYQLGRHVEKLPEPPIRPTPQSDARLAYYDFALVLRDGVWSFNSMASPDREAAVSDARNLVASLTTSAPQPYSVGVFHTHPDPSTHARAIERARDHIAKGDIFQANICLRLDAGFDGDPLDVFCAGLEQLHPAYGAFLRTLEGAIASFSPELFLLRRGQQVLTSPIKGTAPLTTDPAYLIASAKNRAENIMIVDLMRNDLSRVSEPGTVRVPEAYRLERHSVWHLVSDVEARLREDINDGELLRAAFPPGSVTGAPKVRAMEIINDLESTGREAYTGALGYIGPAGLELNVVIRTFEFADQRVWLGVGGGIVIDSDPHDEVIECFAKAEPLISAIGATVDHEGWSPRTSEEQSVVPPPLIEARPDDTQGFFSTMLVIDGVIVDAEAHRERLLQSGADLGLDAAAGWVLAERVAAGLEGRHRLRLDLVADEEPSVRLAELDDEPIEPWSLTTVTVPDGWGSHKWRDREIIDQDDYLFVDKSMHVLETSRAAIFVVRDEGIYVPPLDGKILPSIMRARIIERARLHGIDVHEAPIHMGDIASAGEVFAANAVRGVVPVTEALPYGRWDVGPLTAWLRDELDPRKEPAPVIVPVDTSVGKGARVLLIDNYDSFVYNLAHYLAELGADTEVVRNDAFTIGALESALKDGSFSHIVVSPGPGTPREAGLSIEAIRVAKRYVPILGVCLGHQAIAEAFGADTVQAPEPIHGKPSLIWHDGAGVYRGLNGPLVAARYHSLLVENPGPQLAVTARTANGIVMGIRHRDRRIEGVQMHPESILTKHGHKLIANFLAF